MPDGLTFVLVHGAWHGGWCWDHVADRLRGLGHRVFTPTCTGLGERAHLISKDITLDTFGTDVGNVIEAEELDQVVLVAHSFAGSVASILAERMPRRLKQLVYLDALIVEPGKSPFDSIPAELVASRRKQAAETSGGVSLPNPPPSAFGVPDGPASPCPVRRMRSPLSTPSGICTDSVRVSSMRPSPWHFLHGFSMVWPLPLQCGQACWIEKMPFCMRTWPWPWQVAHLDTLPSAEPLPLQ